MAVNFLEISVLDQPKLSYCWWRDRDDQVGLSKKMSSALDGVLIFRP